MPTSKEPNSQNVSPPSTAKRILGNQKYPKEKLPIAEHYVCNRSPIADPIVSKVGGKFGQISNPYEIIEVNPWGCHVGCAESRWLEAWGAVGEHLSEIPERSPKYQAIGAVEFKH